MAVWIFLIFVFVSVACVISKNFCIKNINLFFKATLLFLIYFFHMLKISLVSLNFF